MDSIESIIIAIVGLGTTSIVAIYIAALANQRARVAHELAESLGRGLIQLSELVEETDESLTNSIADVRRRVESRCDA
jgi:hypothetical protein